ncbi:protein CYSTEINE-RICH TRANSMEMBRANE MODULE 9 [Lactuca sativa]|uniref:protein CYSTEINE-RICH TRANSMEMBRANE MODULE 9 n=1 Tax=Lactuca sativa TaxID=4236 RepID=UPI000CCA2A47|nr:protein CYSTEINE-RICH TRANSMEMBRANE MODULE 9 [Lactuca sativa]
MSTYEQNQLPQVHNYPVEGGTGKGYVAAPPLPPPPVVGPTLKDGYESGGHNPPHGTQPRGDGFWRGCCAGLCCCCLLDACF